MCMLFYIQPSPKQGTILDLIKHYTFVRETDRQTETDRKTETGTDRDTDTEKERDTEKKEGEREKDRQTGRQKDLCRLLGPMKILAYVGVH